MFGVALLAEGVDRNSIRYNEVGGFFTVALLAEGVDRNTAIPLTEPARRLVALLAEGVDRNIVPLEQVIYCRVALLAEGVDRNNADGFVLGGIYPSPSSRRAWIEIQK